MPKFSKRSEQKLLTCDKDLQILMKEVIKEIDFAVICGYRGKFEQEKAYNEGRSKAKFGKSKHNIMPSKAVDIVPIPLDWNDIESFEKLGAKVMEKAEALNIKLMWGKNFKKLKDYPHFELL